MDKIIEEDIDWLAKNINWKEFSDSKILITGASGSIARYLVYFFMYLNGYGAKCDVYALVRDETKAKKIFSDYLETQRFHLEIGNVEDNSWLAEEKAYVFHAAGISSTALFGSYPVNVLETNVIGTYNLLKTLQESKKLKRFIFFSSGSVYGNLPDVNMCVDEKKYYAFDPFEISGCYTEGKRAGELLCYSFWKQYGLPVVMARIGHTYGPGIDIYDGHVYSDFVRAILEKNDIVIQNPDTVRPFTYVRDTVWGILLMALAGKEGDAYNVWNTEERMSIGELADLLTKEIFPERHIKVYYNQELFCNKFDEKKSRMKRNDTKKLEQLGWVAKIKVQEGLKKTIKYMEKRKYEIR